MTIGHDLILAVYGLGTVVSLVLGGFIWYNRDKTGAVPLSVFLFATALYPGPLSSWSPSTVSRSLDS